MGKVRCPRHEDTHPSVEVYENGGYCFSGCGSIPLSELGLTNETQRPKERIREDLAARRAYISTLPVGTFRGFSFPYDERGFYLLFPGSEYYKQRLFNPGKRGKYLNPTGHPQPLFKARLLSLPTLFLVEGEFNCLSIAEAFKESDVISPGSAGDFYSKKTVSLFTHLPYYDKIIIVVDRDAAGVAAAINAKTLLKNKAKQIKILFMEEDANQIHEEKGIAALRAEIEKKLPTAL